MKFELTNNHVFVLAITLPILLVAYFIYDSGKTDRAYIEHGYVQVDGKWVKEK